MFDLAGGGAGALAFDELHVELGVGNVFPTGAVDRGHRSGAEAEVVVALPVGLVVDGFVTGAGVVGDFVMIKSGFLKTGGGFGEVIDVDVGELLELTAGELFEILGVFLVVEIVGGNVIRLESDCFFQCIEPGGEWLTGNGEHEVDVYRWEIGVAKDLIGILRIVRRVVATECGECFGIEGLDAEADAVDTGIANSFGFVRAEGGGIGFNAELAGFI